MKKKDVREPDEKKIASLVRQLLVELGEDPGRNGLQKTPARVAKSLAFLTRGYRQTPRGVLNNAIFETGANLLTRGYRQTPRGVLNGAVFDTGANHMIVLRGIEVYSMCEHHLLPFLLGVSKLARIVDVFARRLQIQERLTEQVAAAVGEAAKAEGVGVVFRCRHLCMMMRGVEKQNSEMVTSAMLGSFRSDEKVRQEFLSLVNR